MRTKVPTTTQGLTFPASTTRRVNFTSQWRCRGGIPLQSPYHQSSRRCSSSSFSPKWTLDFLYWANRRQLWLGCLARRNWSTKWPPMKQSMVDSLARVSRSGTRKAAKCARRGTYAHTTPDNRSRFVHSCRRKVKSVRWFWFEIICHCQSSR